MQPPAGSVGSGRRLRVAMGGIDPGPAAPAASRAGPNPSRIPASLLAEELAADLNAPRPERRRDRRLLAQLELELQVLILLLLKALSLPLDLPP